MSDLVPVLETERLRLRGHVIGDFDAVRDMWADPDVVAHISGTPATAEASWSRFLRYAGHWHHLGFGFWAVETKSDRQFLGEVGFADFHRDTTPSLAGTPEAGWVFRTAAHGQGFATEAVREILGWADENLDAARTACIFAPSHTVSQKVARKCGYGNVVMGHCGPLETLFMDRPRYGQPSGGGLDRSP